MRVLFKLTPVMIILGATATPAVAMDTTVYLANATDVDITDIGVSAAGESDWLDVDQGTVLHPGYSFDLVFGDSDGCRFDFRASYADGNQETITGVEICQASQAGEVWVEFNMAADLLIPE